MAGEQAKIAEIIEPEEVDGPSEAMRDLFSDGAIKLRAGGYAIPRIGPRGRPRGALNKNSRAFKLRDYIAARGFKDPGQFLASIYSADTDELARMLSCDRAEAMKMQISAANNLMPYMHKKLPQELEIAPQEGRPVLVIGKLDTTGADTEESSRLSLEKALAEFAEPEGDEPEEEGEP